MAQRAYRTSSLITDAHAPQVLATGNHKWVVVPLSEFPLEGRVPYPETQLSGCTLVAPPRPFSSPCLLPPPSFVSLRQTTFGHFAAPHSGRVANHGDNTREPVLPPTPPRKGWWQSEGTQDLPRGSGLGLMLAHRLGLEGGQGIGLGLGLGSESGPALRPNHPSPHHPLTPPFFIPSAPPPGACATFRHLSLAEQTAPAQALSGGFQPPPPPKGNGGRGTEGGLAWGGRLKF